MASHPLNDNYRAERMRLIELGRSLNDFQAATKTDACPAWSIKDVYAHLAGIADNIVTGDLEGVATEAWADGHVAARAHHSLAQVLDEWETQGNAVSDVMDSDAGDAFPLELFLDQWTHGWDIRGAIGPDAAAVPDVSPVAYFIDEIFDRLIPGSPGDLEALRLRLANRTFALGVGGPIGEMELGVFEFGRIIMGRRSLDQLRSLPWPDAIDDPSPYIDAMVFWSVNSQDVTEPIAV